MSERRSAFAVRPGGWPRSSVVLRALLLALVLALPGGGRNSPAGAQQPVTADQMSPRGFNQAIQFDNSDPVEEQKRLRALNAERQKSMVSDADKLLKLARELNAEVGADPSSLTANDLRKAGEIERLARSVKEKMSFSVGSAPVFQQSLPRLFQ
jgi:hypothetical protein